MDFLNNGIGNFVHLISIIRFILIVGFAVRRFQWPIDSRFFVNKIYCPQCSTNFIFDQ